MQKNLSLKIYLEKITSSKPLIIRSILEKDHLIENVFVNKYNNVMRNDQKFISLLSFLFLSNNKNVFFKFFVFALMEEEKQLLFEINHPDNASRFQIILVIIRMFELKNIFPQNFANLLETFVNVLQKEPQGSLFKSFCDIIKNIIKAMKIIILFDDPNSNKDFQAKYSNIKNTSLDLLEQLISKVPEDQFDRILIEFN